jgi:uncharacterized membrane protein
MQFEVSIDIDRPPEVVWPVMADVERWHEWTASIRSIKRLDAGAFGVGSRARVHQPKLQAMVWRVTEFEQGRSFAWETRGPGICVVGRHAVQTNARGSRVTLGIVQKGWLATLLRPLTEALTRRYVKMEVEGLKRRCESELL